MQPLAFLSFNLPLAKAEFRLRLMSRGIRQVIGIRISMEKNFKYPKRSYLFILTLVIIFFPLSKGLIYESFPIENYSFSIISISLVTFLLYLVIIVWQ
jgi:hypothetical protein